MRTRTQLSTLSPIACAIALGLGVFTSGAYASSPILSVSGVVTGSLNLGGTTTTSPSSIQTYPDWNNFNFNTSSVSDFSSEVQIQPTTSTSGLAYDYETITTTHTWDHVTWKRDYLSINVTSDGTNQSGNKWISLTGTVTSTVNTTLSFYLSAGGSFTATNSPFGPTAPLLASFYFGSTQPTPLSSTTNTDLANASYSTYSSSYSTDSFNLIGGVAQNFVAYVYAPTDVSISYFDLNAFTSNYDYVTAPQSQIYIGSKTLIGSHLLAPIPEPETYGMMLAGLGLVGAVIRRRNNAVV